MNQELPRARDAVEHVVIDGETVVYDPDRSALHVLNVTATVVWEHCDGTGTVSALVDGLADVYGAEPAEIERDVRAYLDELAALELLEPR
jgi:hypothetical protein